MKNIIKIAIGFGLLLSVIACSDDPMGPNTETGATISMAIVSNNSSLQKSAGINSITITDIGGTNFTITEARVNVRHIQLDFPEEDSLSHDSDSSSQISIDGPFVIDLMNSSSNGAIGPFKLLDGTYKRIDVRLDDTKLEDGLVTPLDQLFENTLVVKGTFDYNGITNRSFTIILKFNEDVRFEKPNGIIIREGTIKNIIVNLKVDEWLQNINITDCLNNRDIVLDSNGDLLIDDSNGNGACNRLEEILKQNIKNNYDVN